jgi:hypothetical protein
MVLVLLIAPRAADVRAQQATPVVAVPVARPVHIHSGDCENLGEVVQPLTDLTAPTGVGRGQAARATMGESSFTNVPLTLDAILAADHAINAHLSAEQIGTYIACGEIGGTREADGTLIIGLREMSNSGYTGIAYLTPGADGASTDVTVFIAPVLGAAG